MSPDQKSEILLILVQISMAAVRSRIRKSIDACLLLLLEDKDTKCQPPETLAPRPTTMATTGLLDTCLVLLSKVSLGCPGCRACRDTVTQSNNGKTKHFM